MWWQWRSGPVLKPQMTRSCSATPPTTHSGRSSGTDFTMRPVRSHTRGTQKLDAHRAAAAARANEAAKPREPFASRQRGTPVHSPGLDKSQRTVQRHAQAAMSDQALEELGSMDIPLRCASPKGSQQPTACLLPSCCRAQRLLRAEVAGPRYRTAVTAAIIERLLGHRTCLHQQQQCVC